MSDEQPSKQPSKQSSEQPPVPDFAAGQEFETEEVTLENGTKYTIGRPKGSAVAYEKAQAAKAAKEDDDADVLDSHGPSFELDVDWRAGSGGPTDSGFRSRTGISQYHVPIGGVLYKYRVWITTDQSYYYEFQDEGHQSYPLDVVLNGSHYVDYNSKQPNIIKVRGS
ncbi:hypothetical protein BDV95DRAFT_608436 [Massariosphaeria phaeospora]|uniref:Uncharacterized protein n=1 Tax=Massariosphaeria phaeospora TaxID=100035 RepID=A0A7C8I6P6_9PLEO|nr:hypothetical protein BDV95DRAFT_608436 [Massariosphaeria phaeospora]